MRPELIFGMVWVHDMSLFVYRSRKFNRLYGLVIFLFTFWFLAGLVVVGFGIESAMSGWSDFTFIALASLVLLLHLSANSHGGSALILFSLFMIVSLLVEFSGALLGFPFGSHEYSANLGPRMFGLVPFAVPLSWWVIVWPLHCLVHSAQAGRGSMVLVPVITAFWAVVADMLIEPGATLVRGYWEWETEGFYYGVPWTNFLSWFVIAFVLSFAAQVLLPHSPFKREELRVPVWVLCATVSLFVFVAILHGMWWVLAVAVFFFVCVRRMRKQARSSSLSQ